MRTALKQVLMRLWCGTVLSDKEVELLIHFFQIEDA